MDEKAIFGQMCQQALVNQYNREMSQCQENAKCSHAHYRKMSAILGYKVKENRRFTKRVIAAILAAVILLLAGCTAYVYREELRGLVAEIHELYIKIFPDDGNRNQAQDTITEIYSLDYVPDGYTIVRESIWSSRVRYEWRNEFGDAIIFTQSTTISGSFDREHGGYEIINIDGKEIFYHYGVSSYVYLWFDGKYYMDLTFDEELPEDELLFILNGIEVHE